MAPALRPPGRCALRGLRSPLPPPPTARPPRWRTCLYGHPSERCCRSGVLQNRAALRSERAATRVEGRDRGAFPRSHPCSPVRGPVNARQVSGLGEKRSRGVRPAEVSGRGSPARPVGNLRLRPQVSDGGFPERRGRRSAFQQRRSGPALESRGDRSSRGSAGGRPGGEARRGKQSTRVNGWMRRRPLGGTRGPVGRGRGPRQVRGSPGPAASAYARAPRQTPAGLHTCPGWSTRPRPEGAPTARRKGAGPGEGSPVRDGACAVARARPSAGKEHAQCEGKRATWEPGACSVRAGPGARAEALRARNPPAERKRRREITSELRQERPRFAGRLWPPTGPAVLLGPGA